MFRFFKRKNEQDKIPLLNNFSDVAVDIHSHLLHGIDDGVKSIDESIELIKQYKELSFKKIIITPHINSDYYKNTQEIIQNKLDELKEAVEKNGIDIQLDFAAEYMLDDGFRKKIDKGDLLTIKGNYVLLELQSTNEPFYLNEVIFDLQIAGYKVILAHPERYGFWFNKFQKFAELKDRDVFFQINAVSLSGLYPHSTQLIAHKLIENKFIDFIGSDVHNQKYMDYFQNSLKSKYLSILMSSGLVKNNTLL